MALHVQERLRFFNDFPLDIMEAKRILDSIIKVSKNMINMNSKNNKLISKIKKKLKHSQTKTDKIYHS